MLWKAFICMLFIVKAEFSSDDGNETPNISPNKFAVKLLKEVSKKEGNFVLAPYSIELALGMLYGATRGDSSSQIESLLDIEELADNDFHLAMNRFRTKLKHLTSANNIWAAGDIKVSPAYLKLLLWYYDAKLGFLDTSNLIEATRSINNWVEKQTDGMIKNFFPDNTIKKNTKVILVNALFFKGKWKEAFPKEATRKGIFRLQGGKKMIAVDMMSLSNVTFRYFHDKKLKLKVVELPYEKNGFTMWVAVPQNGRSLTDIFDLLKHNDFFAWNRSMADKNLDVMIPRFSIESDLDLKDILSKLGAKNLFNMNADLSGLNGRKNLYVSAAVHKARLEVDEKGTKAAAATGFATSLFSARPTRTVFIADQPFLVFIIHRETQVVVFSGRITDPRTK